MLFLCSALWRKSTQLMAIVLTDNQLCYSVYDTEHKILHSTFKGRFNKELNLKHLKTVGEFSEDNVILGSIVDVTNLRGSFASMFETMETKTLPGVKKAGFKYVAYVLSDDILMKAVINKWVEIAKGLNLKIEMFESVTDAKDWIIKAIKSEKK